MRVIWTFEGDWLLAARDPAGLLRGVWLTDVRWGRALAHVLNAAPDLASALLPPWGGGAERAQ
jgi:hypothetical protein